MTVPVRPRALVAGALFTATTLLTVACGSDTDPSASAGTNRPTTTVAPVKAARPDQVLRFSAKEYSFTGPKEAPAGLTELTLTNDGAEDHQLALFRMNEGVEPGTVLGALGEKGLDAGLQFGTWVPGPNGTAPGLTTSVVSDLEPGRYIVACVIPDSTGAPHAMKGMLTDLTVTAAAKPATQEADGLPEVRLGDYHFELPKDIGSGPLVIVNGGDVVHEAVIAKISDGKTVADLVEYESQPFPRTGKAPYTLVDGTTFLDPGGRARLDLDLPAGDYAFVCFLPGPGGKPHLALGMVHPFTVS
jgi:uncharacterized cupredoxin-like copper-binding protein